MADWTGPVLRWAGGAALLGYAGYDFVGHHDRVGAWVSLIIGGYLIVRGFIRR
jgi:hypothetical protein